MSERDELAEVLSEHEPIGGGWFCHCTPEDEDGVRESLPHSWETHLADALLASAALGRMLDKARTDALRPLLEAYPRGCDGLGCGGWDDLLPEVKQR